MRDRNYGYVVIALLTLSGTTHATVWFADSEPPGEGYASADAPLCFQFSAHSLQEQLGRLAQKYEGLDSSYISKGKLTVTTPDGRELVYFDSPKACQAYQEGRFSAQQYSDGEEDAEPVESIPAFTTTPGKPKLDPLPIYTDEYGDIIVVDRAHITRTENRVVAIGALISGVKGLPDVGVYLYAECDTRKAGCMDKDREFSWFDGKEQAAVVNYLCPM